MSFFQDVRGQRRHGMVPERTVARDVYTSLSVAARLVTPYIDQFLHRTIDALAAAKSRRLQRELQLRGITYAHVERHAARINNSHNEA